ncbi:MAG: MATE family efflux transporter [Rikenellaceae bacterium]|nr:MATE family efflux transporter [Rikenellaceae bacterium]
MSLFFNTYKSFYKENLKLALPVILSQVGQITVQLADTAMVGRYGGDDPVPLAAVSYATSLFFIVFVTAMGLTFGLTPLVGEHYAKGNKSYVSELLRSGFVLYGIIGAITTLLLFAIRPMFRIMGGMMISSGSDASINEVIDMALPYYDIIIWTIFPIMIWGTAKQFLEGIGNTKVAMVTIIISNVINIFLNWVFIFGHFGFEAMGAVGAGLATLIARVAQCVVMLAYFLYSPKFREYTKGLFRLVTPHFKAIIETLKVGIPISFQMLMEASAFALAGVLVLAFGAHSVSAYQIGTNMMNVTFMIVIAIGSATTILCSHIYGRRNFENLRKTIYASYQMGLMWNITVALLFVLLRNHIPALFTSNQETIKLTATMLIFIALFQVSDCLQAISISVLRGLQDVKVIMPIVVISYIIFNIPVGYLLAFNCGFESIGLIVGFIVGLSICATLTILRVRRDINRLERRVGN